MATIRAAIKTTLDGVSGIGKTHDCYRLLATQKAIEDECVTAAGKFHVWMVMVQSLEAAYRYPMSHERAKYLFEVWGWYAVSDEDASEKEWEAIVEAVCAAFRDSKKLGLQSAIIDSGPIEWVEAGYRTFCGTTCHFARLQVPVLEQVTP